MDEKGTRSFDSGTTQSVEDARRGSRRKSYLDVNFDKLSAAFENPLANISKEQLLSDVETFCKDNGLMEHIEEFRKGALVASDPDNAKNLTELTDEDRLVLERETTHKWYVTPMSSG
jgi:hypothetical protein